MDGAAFLQLTTRLSRRTHSPHPFHLVAGLELLGDALLRRHLLSQQVEHFLRLPVDLGNVIVKGTAQEHRGVDCAPMLFQSVPILLAPDTDRFALRQG